MSPVTAFFLGMLFMGICGFVLVMWAGRDELNDYRDEQ